MPKGQDIVSTTLEVKCAINMSYKCGHQRVWWLAGGGELGVGLRGGGKGCYPNRGSYLTFTLLALLFLYHVLCSQDGVAQEERFELVAHDKTEHLFSTNSAADCQHWIGVLSEAVYRSQKKERKEQRRLKRQASMVDESKRPSSRAGGQTTGSISPGTHTPASQGSRTPGTNTPPVSLPVSPKHLAAAATTSSKALPRKLSMINAAQNSVIAKIEPPLPPVRPMKPKPPALSRPANDLALPEKVRWCCGQLNCTCVSCLSIHIM